MWLDEYFSKQLKEGEEPIRVVRRYKLTMIPALAGSILVIVLDFFLLAWWLQWRAWGLFGFTLVLGGGILWGARTLYLWSRNVLILTNLRIIDIDQRGLFNRTVAEAPYRKIQDVRYTLHGLWQTLLHYGTIIIQTAGNTTNLELAKVHQPQVLQQQITDLQEQVESSGAKTGSGDVTQAIDALRQALNQPTKSADPTNHEDV